MNISQADKAKVEGLVRERIQEENAKPFIVSVMGIVQSKQNLFLNALLGSRLPIDPVRPYTKSIETSMIGTSIKFLNLPSIESESLLQNYTPIYRRHLFESDVVLWVVSDKVLSSFERNILNTIMGDNPNEQTESTNKVVLVSTKNDEATSLQIAYKSMIYANEDFGEFEIAPYKRFWTTLSRRNL